MATVITAPKRKSSFNLKVWIIEPRPQYLILPVVLILIGTAAAAYYADSFSIGYALLALFGLALCHMSVNIINDYFDYLSGVDLKTTKSPFNGGSGILPAGLLTPRQVLWYGIICFALAIPVGIYFTVIQGWQLLPLLVLGGVCVIFYTSIILKNHFPEWSPGVGLGILPVLGAYFVQTGGYSWEAVIASVPSGFLVLNLLLLNEFPDAEADLIGHKKTLPITMGKRNSAIIYTVFNVLTYLWVIGAVAARVMPVFCLMSLLTVPLAFQAVRGAFSYKNDLKVILPAMANNVKVVILTQALLGAGYVIGAVLN